LRVELRENTAYYFSVMQKQTQEKKTITFRLDSNKVAELDEVAEAQDRDRTYLLNEAVEAYLEVQRWQIEHIKEGIRQANSGAGVPHAEVLAKWRRRLR